MVGYMRAAGKSYGKMRRAAAPSIARALPYGSRRRGAVVGNTIGARRRRMAAGGILAGGLGVNAAVGPRHRSSGRNGIRGNSVGGGRGF